ncbi:hypothetical protein [Thiocapsa imhoffii]|uniref:hypothetical protein n=1 Tax=Thiocapsa imhoffii TaxID=382777 RepID=UPI003FCCB455
MTFPSTQIPSGNNCESKPTRPTAMKSDRTEVSVRIRRSLGQKADTQIIGADTLEISRIRKLHEVSTQDLAGGNRRIKSAPSATSEKSISSKCSLLIVTGLWVRSMLENKPASVGVGHLDVIGVVLLPSKTDAPLVVDAKAPLTITIAAKLFQAVGRRHALGLFPRSMFASSRRTKPLAREGRGDRILEQKGGGLAAYGAGLRASEVVSLFVDACTFH